jgi:hypothetical protein
MPGSSTANRGQVQYLWGAAIVWAAIWVATAVVLKDRGGFAGMIPILTIGTGWFLAVVPALDRTGSTGKSNSPPR